jgi:hypothetical protein
MLKGMDFERFIPLFAKANVSLEEFLTIDDERLEEIGVPLPYQRKLILRELQKFFSKKWNNKSLWLPPSIHSQISPVDLIHILANVLRQVVVIKSHLVYLKKESQKEQFSSTQFTFEHFNEFEMRVNELCGLLSGLQATERPLLISKQTLPLQCNVAKAKGPSRLKKNAAIISIVPLALTLLVVTFKIFYRK